MIQKGWRLGYEEKREEEEEGREGTAEDEQSPVVDVQEEDVEVDVMLDKVVPHDEEGKEGHHHTAQVGEGEDGKHGRPSLLL